MLPFFDSDNPTDAPDEEENSNINFCPAKAWPEPVRERLKKFFLIRSSGA
jgi:hypothetical protein